MKLSAVLLAGGLSKRMGRDKATLPWKEGALWQNQLQLLRRLQPAEIFVSARVDPSWRPADLKFAADAVPSRGALSGLAAVMSEMAGTHLLALAIDMPRLRQRWLDLLWRKSQPGCGTIPTIRERFEPLCAIYPREIHNDFSAALEGDDFSLQSLARNFVAAERLKIISVPESEEDSFWNFNSAQDLVDRDL